MDTEDYQEESDLRSCLVLQEINDFAVDFTPDDYLLLQEIC